MNERNVKYIKKIIFFALFLAIVVFTLNNHLNTLTQRQLNEKLSQKLEQTRIENETPIQAPVNSPQNEIMKRYLESRVEENKPIQEEKSFEIPTNNYFQEGVSYFESDMLDDAIESFKKASEEGNEKERIESIKYIAKSYEKKGEYLLAIDNYNIIISVVQDVYELKNIYQKIISNYIQLQDTNRALFYFEQLFRLTYQKEDFLNALNYAKSLDDKESAERIIDEYLEKNPQDGYELTEYFNWLKS